MSSTILPLIAQGPTPVAPIDTLGNMAKIAGIQQQRAQTAATNAQLPLIQAQTQGAQEAAHGAALDNALKQRNVDSLKSLGTLMQQNTHKLPDGSQATDMASVLGQYRSLYPDKALELESHTLELQNQRTLAAKNDFDLESNQIKNLGFKAGTAGVGDPSFAARPDAPQVYANLYKNAQQNHTEHLLPATPQQFAQNPSAYASKLSDFVQQSGAQSEVLAQKSAQLTAFQQKLEQGRTMHAQGMASVQSPDDYAKLYAAESRSLDPEAFAALNLPPPKTITNAKQIAAAKQSATLSQMSPKDRSEYLEQVRHNTQTEISDRIGANAKQTEAAVASGKLALDQAEFNKNWVPEDQQPPPPAQTGPGGGAPASTPTTGGGAPAPPTAANPAGRAATSLTPPVGGPRATAQAANTPATAPAAPAAAQQQGAPPAAQQENTGPAYNDISKLNIPRPDGSVSNPGPATQAVWRHEPPAVQRKALAFLEGKNVPSRTGKGDLDDRAYSLAVKVWPNFQSAVNQRSDYYGKSVQASTNANTAMAHSQELFDMAKNSGNTKLRPLNMATMQTRMALGDPAPTELENQRDRYASELDKYFSAGTSTAGERERALGPLSIANSPETLMKVVKDNNRMMYQGMKVRENQFNNAMGGNLTGEGVSLVHPDSQDILKKQGIIKADASSGSSGPKKTATMQHVNDYAQKYLGGNVAKALDLFKKDGVEIK